ncbi:hypothetical protein [Streptomyces paromomycinus]|uniref:Uncharacterized protein n=1 Tax=Streptomyces paromomycinus TaxID=92743 RepID=A0A401WA01_STREY|nr:hypothetical protein [Streptomyces paromomycinus]GCD46121.1 hypothetical protein GKJPGBOP_05868 [Streptomyces paromomycinus]
MHWFLIAVAALLLPPTFAAEGWVRIYLGVLAFACTVGAMVASRLRD